MWNSTLSNRDAARDALRLQPVLADARAEQQDRSEDLGINTGPLDAADLGVPGVTTPFGHIGGVGGYPITTKPTTTTQVSVALDAHARIAHVQDGRQLGLRLQPQRAESGANHADRQRRAAAMTSTRSSVCCWHASKSRRARSGRPNGIWARHRSASFINDEWKATSRLTLTAGLRYEVFSPVSEQDNLATNFFPDRGLGAARVQRSGPAVHVGQEQLRTARRPGVGRDRRRQNERARQLLAHLRLCRRWARFTRDCSRRRRSACSACRSRSRRGSHRTPPDVRCVDPNNSSAGGDYVCLQPGVPVFGSSPTGAPPFNIFQVPEDFQLGRYHYYHLTFQREICAATTR